MSQLNSSAEILTPPDSKKDHQELDISSNTSTDYAIKKEPPDYHLNGGLFKFLSNIKSSSNKLQDTYSKQLRYFWYIVIYSLLIGYFAWATKHFIDNQKEFSDLTLSSTACTGYGFFMILFILINFGILYSWILKPYCIPVISRPIKSCRQGIQDLAQYRCLMNILHGLLLVGTLAFLIIDAREDFSRLTPLAGLVFYFVVGLLMCNNPTRIKWQTVIRGLLLQFAFGLLTIRWEVGRNIFQCIGDKVTKFLSYSNDGATFVYGEFLVEKEKVFVFQALSAIYFLSFTVNILYHYGIMQKIILAIGIFLKTIMGTTICESVNSAANIFLGMTEAPLLLKPYLEHLTSSELFSIMSTGFATVSGTVLAAYISFGANASHLVTASVMSAPAALCFSKLVYPETEEIKATKESIAITKSEYSSALDAASSGASTALQLVLGITANLIAFIAFLYFLNGVLGFLGELVGYSAAEDTWKIEKFASYVFMPISYTMGVPWNECLKVGKLIGLKTIVNEFAAYKEMGQMELTPRTKVIATYAICGFSNPASIGIMISTLSLLVPTRRNTVIKLAFKSCIAGAIICFMTACIAGLLIPEHLLDI